MGLTVAAGLSTRSLLRPVIGKFWAANLGDALWAVLVYLILVFLRPTLPAKTAAIVTLLISIAVECSQLIQTPALDHWRRETIAGLVLGYGFSWGDLVAYAVGIAVAWAVEAASRVEPRGSAGEGT